MTDNSVFIWHYTIYASKQSSINLRVMALNDVIICNKYNYDNDIGFRRK